VGKVDGALPAQGNGLQAGIGQLNTFDASFTASFQVAQAGDVTFNVTSEDGFMLGVGGGASRVSGAYENPPASNQSVFQNLPLVGAYNESCCSTPQTHQVTVHFPAPGSYPYELDYFQHGGSPLSLVMSVATVTKVTAPLSVYAGYADGLRPAGSTFPFPWLGSPGVLFEGCSNSCSFDGGAVRVVNNQSSPMTINSVVVHFSADCTYDIWPHDVSLPANQQMILAQTASGADNGCSASRGTMDSSDIGTNGAPWSGNCNQSGMIPEIDVTAGGVTTSYQDTGQVLNTGGVDSASCGASNESEAWTLIGGQQTTVNEPLPPAVFLSLAPSTVSGDVVGQTQKLTVTALDASGKPVPNLPVRLHVFGANGGDMDVTTNSDGIAQSSYTGTNAGQDNVSATASISGMQTASNQLIVPWGVPSPPPPPPPPSSTSGSQPPSVAITGPQGASQVTGPVPVTATIAAQGSDTITGWSATLTPAGGAAVTLGSGTGTPPATLGSIDPSQLGGGTYDLAVSASTAGGTATETEQITIGTTPGLPPPAPIRSSTGAPSIGAITPANGAVVGVTTTVSATASAPAGDSISEWSITLTPSGGSAATTLGAGDSSQPSPQATLDPSQYAPGPYALTVTVHTADGGYATESETVTLGTGSATGAATPPAISPITVGTASTTTGSDGSVTATPTPVSATITPPSGQSVATWAITAQGSHDATSRTLASGTGAPPSTLATVDTTQLPNDTYRITVEATDSSGAVQTQSSYLVVSGNLKLGRFVRTYQDLDVPVTGFDMQVNRTYDSTDKSVGDFGVGWHLNLANFVVSTNGPLGEGGWSPSPSDCIYTICGYAYTSTTPHTVTITWPDKHQEVFDFTPTGPQLDNIDVTPAFTPRPGTNTTSTLQVDGNADITNGFDGSLYDADGNPWTATRFDLTTRDGRKFVLDTTTGLVSETDRSGDTMTIDSSGVHSSAGPSLTFTRDAEGRITDIAGPTGQHLKYAYSPAGDLASYTDADGNTTNYSYDSNHRLLDTTAAGADTPVQQLIYDPSTGRLSQVIDGDGNVTNVSIDTSNHTETVADPNGKLTTINTYDNLGDLTEQDKVFGGQTLKTTHTYDSVGRLLSTTDPLGHTTSYTYDAAGDITSSTDADGKTTQYQYDSSGNVTAVVSPDGSKQLAITRDGNGNPTRVQLADGSAYTYAYDAEGRPTHVTEPSGVSETISYDSNGHPSSITDASGQVTQLTSDASGNLLSQTDPSGRTTKFTYDGNGNLASLTDGLGHVTTFTYDALGHQVSATDPLGRTTTSTYDPAGRLVQQIDGNGQKTTYTYDADGNPIQESFSDGDYTDVTYDGLERPTTVTSPTQTLGFTYDGAGRMTSASSSAVGSAPATTLNYTYDPAGNRTSMTGPDGTTNYGYDASSRLTSVAPSTEPGGGQFSFSYAPSGALATLSRPDGINDTLTYNGSQLLSRIATSGSSTVAAATYTYGPTDLRTSTTDGSGATTTYGYDPTGQVTQASPAGGASTSFSYDAAGNRTGGSYDAAEELTSDGTSTYTYDGDGQLVKRVTNATGAATTYDWNARHELTAIHRPDGSTEEFAYDPLGRRVSVTDGGHTTSYVYDGANIHLEYDGNSSAPAAVYTDGNAPDQVLEMARDGHRYSYLVDGQGSTIALADENGNVVQRYSYDAFGTPTVTGSVPNPFTYTGREYDAASGLYYYRARYYDPTLGRFISEDPVQHANPYPYVTNDPINASDPTGAQDLSDMESEIVVVDITDELDEFVGQQIGKEVLNEGLNSLVTTLDEQLSTYDIENSGLPGSESAAEVAKVAWTVNSVKEAIEAIRGLQAFLTGPPSPFQATHVYDDLEAVLNVESLIGTGFSLAEQAQYVNEHVLH
jgi:RHS repeat-associated protein